MVKKSLHSKILFSVITTLMIGLSIFYFVTYDKIKKEIDENQFFIYNQSIQTQMFFLEEKYNSLYNAGLIESYEDSFKEGILELFRKMFYNKNLEIYPYIIDAKDNTYLLHPRYNKNNKVEYKNSEILKKSIEIKNGEFNLYNEKNNNWIIVQSFEKWDWVIGYKVSFDVKYKSLYTFQSNFIVILLLLLLIVSLIIWISVRKLLNPINQLILESKKIKEGNLDSEISINASYELSELSNNFISMRNSVKNNIYKLNNTKKLLNNIIDNAPIRIFWKDKNLKFLGANKLFLEDFGNIKIQDLLGKTDIDFDIKEAQKYRDDDLEVMNENKSKLNFIETQKFDNKKELIISTSKVPLKDLDGEVIGVLGVYNDITEQVRLQNELKEHEKLLVQQSKMATMGEMIGSIAHQWKQPISIISMSSGILRLAREEEDLISTEQINDSLDYIDNAVVNLTQTIDDFRNFFNPNKERTLFKIKDAFSETFKLTLSQFKNNNIKIIECIDDKELYGSQNELQQTLINLLKNAKEALVKKESQEKRLLFIESYIENKKIVIKIKDNAGGIPADIIDKVFDSYFTTKEKEGGSGIGLYMCKQIIEGSMKGSIKAVNVNYFYENINYDGAEFIIEIPLDLRVNRTRS